VPIGPFGLCGATGMNDARQSASTGRPARRRALRRRPSIVVPRELAGQQRHGYYLLMFLEAYANGGRWGYYWRPGVDAETRLRETAPEVLKRYIRFIADHRNLYEGAVPENDLAILTPTGRSCGDPVRT
jgi:hypothetical protein